MVYLLFPLAFLLHNIEEGIWLPAWTERVKPFGRVTGAFEFRFALLAVTLLGTGVSVLWILFPASVFLKYFYFGFLGTMCVNVFFPHLAATLLFRKYSPGLLSGLIFLLPVCILLSHKAIREGIIRGGEWIGATAVLTLIQIACLPLLLRLGKRIQKSGL